MHHYFQMDLLDFFRGVYPWTKLYRLLSRLPDGSEFRAMQALDPELAGELLRIEQVRAEIEARIPIGQRPVKDEVPGPISSAGYTREVALLSAVCNLLQQLNSTLIAVNLPKGKKPPKIQPMPAPVSMFEVLKAESDKAEVDNLLSMIVSEE